MKVKISYQVDLEEVPKIVSKQIEVIEQDIALAMVDISFLKETIFTNPSDKIMNKIKISEERIVDVLNKLAEAGNIYAGYQKALAEERLNSDLDHKTETTMPNNMGYSPEQMQEYLSSLKEWTERFNKNPLDEGDKND